jgi:hypothetical protein
MAQEQQSSASGLPEADEKSLPFLSPIDPDAAPGGSAIVIESFSGNLARLDSQDSLRALLDPCDAG